MQGMMLYTLMLVFATLLAARMLPEAASLRGSRGQAWNMLHLTLLYFLLTLPAILRYYTGNDYYTYIEHFHDVKLDHYVVTEPGFNLLVKLVYAALGGEYFLVIFGIFSAGTVFFFLLGMYKQSRDFTLSVFLFLSLGLYFMSYDTVRYYFTLSLVFCSMHYAVRGQWDKFVLSVLAAFLFHKTALAVLLLYPLAKLRWRPWMAAVLVLGGISGIALKAQYRKLFVWLYPSYVNESEYLAGGSVSIVNIARCLLVIGLSLYLLQFEKKSMEARPEFSFYLKLNVLALIMYACFYYVPFVSRLGYYLNVSQMLLIPLCVDACRGKRRYVLYGLSMAAGILYFIFFLYVAQQPLIRVLPYNTWLSVPDGMKPVF